MKKYEHIINVAFALTKNKSLTKHIIIRPHIYHIMSYIIGEEPCAYLKNVVHYHINKLQVFRSTRFCTCYIDHFMDLDFSDKEDSYILN